MSRASDEQRRSSDLVRPAKVPPGAGNNDRFKAKIDSPIQITGCTNRWDYEFTEVWVDAATGFYVARPNGRAHTARNRIENNNDGMGQEGCGVYVSGYTNVNVTVLAIQNGTIVEIEVEYDSDGNIAYRFSESNDISVDCA